MIEQMFFILLPVLVTAIYLLVLAYFIFGWNKTKPFNEHIQSEIKVSVIVVFRNEASTIQNLLLSLLKQDYPLKCTELIFVDDNSDDKSAAIIQHTLSDRGVDFTIINVAGHGVAKKRALTEGISKASGDLIITTDADCTMGSQWISSIVSYHIVAGCHMIVGPVRLTGNSILQQLQSVEFSVLQKMTCGALYYSNPLMCNGANLAYSRKAYFDVFESQNKSDKPTGDDTYLMFALHKKGNYKIGYLKTSKALVSTEAADSFRNF